MKKQKKLIIYLLILLILISLSKNTKTETTSIVENVFKQENKDNTKMENFPYYKKENKKRYLNYQQKNKTYSLIQILTDVNIGLDNPYYTNIKNAPRQNTPLILVNKYNALSSNYIPNNLELINTKYANPGMKLTKEAKNAFEEMSEAAKKNNLNIIAMSTYRSYSYQEQLYNRYKSIDGQEKTDTYSARPGHSEHQTGLAVDVYNKVLPYTSFEQTDEFIWMKENAYKYGFILRYPKEKEKTTGYKYESWHYRYVGKEIAQYIQKENITYDEYYIRNLDNDQNIKN